MIDIIDALKRAHRAVGQDGETKTVVIRREYDADIEDVWDACTDPERLPRWFLPVSGDLRVGGRYQLEGNAGGEILHCEPPRLLKVTWEMSEQAGMSEVEVRLSPAAGDGTAFELRHTAVVDPEFWNRFGPGAVGVGWDLSLLGLGLHLSGGRIEDPQTWESSPEAREFMKASGQEWGRAHEAAGEDPERAAEMARNTIAFYAPEAPA